MCVFVYVLQNLHVNMYEYILWSVNSVQQYKYVCGFLCVCVRGHDNYWRAAKSGTPCWSVCSD